MARKRGAGRERSPAAKSESRGEKQGPQRKESRGEKQGRHRKESRGEPTAPWGKALGLRGVTFPVGNALAVLGAAKRRAGRERLFRIEKSHPERMAFSWLGIL